MDDGGGVLLDRGVDTVDFARDADFRSGLGLFGCVEDFVDVVYAAEAVDGRAGNVLVQSISDSSLP